MLGRKLQGFSSISVAAFEGRQQEVHVAFDGEAAWSVFDTYYGRDCKDSVPVEPNAIVTVRPGGEVVARETALALEEVPIVRVLNAGLALVDPPARGIPSDRTQRRLGRPTGTDQREMFRSEPRPRGRQR